MVKCCAEMDNIRVGKAVHDSEFISEMQDSWPGM
jgi:hypothetical protein